jgi:quinol-cytochrome oxidoreductase complex cytochrome b subunit
MKIPFIPYVRKTQPMHPQFPFKDSTNCELKIILIASILNISIVCMSLFLKPYSIRTVCAALTLK